MAEDNNTFFKGSCQMKIVHMIGGGDVGGAKTHVLSLVAKLSENDDVLLISFREGEFAEDARALGINTLVIKNRNPLDDIRQLKNVLGDGNFDIVHCHGAKANVMASLVRHCISAPIITTVHSDYRLDYMGNIAKMITNGLLNTIALRTLDGYIGVTHSYADMLMERNFDPYKLYTLNNGIDFSVKPNPKTTRSEYLKSLGIDDDNAVICAVAARFHPVKDIGCAVRAMSRIKDTCPNLYLVLGGDGEQAEYLHGLVREYSLEGRVIFAGWIDDMDTFLNAVDISIISSVSEGFPYSVLESARAKCTMVSTRVGALTTVIDDGENGLLFDVGDDKRLAEHLEMLCKDENMRKTTAERLFDKASREYSFEAMVQAQRSIYQKVYERRENEKKREKNIVVCGSYGRGNAGDDAILKAVVKEIYSVCPDAQICVLSRNPKQTRKNYRVRSVYTFSVFRVMRAMRRSGLYINGGGSLIQDCTSSRSLYFYLFTIWAAHVCKCRIMMYGCGIGPVSKKLNRFLAARTIDKYADSITLRDPDSFSELKKMGVKMPEMCLAADPTLSLLPAPEAKIRKAFENEGLDFGANYICLAIRNWHDIVEKIPHIAAAADHAARRYGLKTVLIPMERTKDIPIAEKVLAKMETPASVIRGEYDVYTTIGILSKMRIIMAMRLHALVFGAGQSVPAIGIAYDHKVTGFMNYIGSEMCVSYGECCYDALRALIDVLMTDSEYESEIKKASADMRANESENIRVLKKYLNKEKDEI